MRNLKKTLLLSVYIMVFFYPIMLNAAEQKSPVAVQQKSLETVQQNLDVLKQQTEANMSILDDANRKERQALRAERQKFMNEVAQRKAQAQVLQDEFTALKLEEERLEIALAEKKDMMASIQSTVSNSANLFLQSVPTYTSAKLPLEQKALLKGLITSKDFPTLQAIKALSDALQANIYQSGIIQKVSETIFTRDGKEISAEILHLGAFQSYFTNGDSFGFTLRTRLLEPLEIAPYVATNSEKDFLRNAFAGNYTLPLDVSEGEILLSPPKRYSLWDNIQESGFFGWCIIVIGIIGLALVTERYIALSRIKLNGEQVAESIVNAKYDMENMNKSPSERVLQQMLQGKGNATLDAQVLERRSEEAMLKELPALERFLHTIRIFASISPLLGLLGTVSGIVTTFRIITSYGNSDPKLLSGGISEALLTTEMGLLVAIPLLLLHHFLSRRVNNIMLDMELASTIVIRHLGKH